MVPSYSVAQCLLVNWQSGALASRNFEECLESLLLGYRGKGLLARKGRGGLKQAFHTMVVAAAHSGPDRALWFFFPTDLLLGKAWKHPIDSGEKISQRPLDVVTLSCT
jgi:hypothetical protein